MTERRGWLARLGLTLLSGFFPGSSHVRLGRFKRAAALFGSYVLLATVLVLLLLFVRDWTFAKWLTLVTTGVLIIPVMITAAILTWLDSRYRSLPVHKYSRWHWVAGTVVATFLVNFAIPGDERRPRSFWIPAESMRPTLEIGDRIVVQQREFAPIRVGAVIVFQAASEFRVNRVAALGGQRVELRRGQVIVDGRPAAILSTSNATMLRERLPGERGMHVIHDEGYSIGDTFGPTTVPAGHVFVLGDNRDNSADSRYSPADYGVGMVPASAIIGQAKFIFWSRDRSRIGRTLEDKP